MLCGLKAIPDKIRMIMVGHLLFCFGRHPVYEAVVLYSSFEDRASKEAAADLVVSSGELSCASHFKAYTSFWLLNYTLQSKSSLPLQAPFAGAWPKNGSLASYGHNIHSLPRALRLVSLRSLPRVNIVLP